MHLLHFSNLVEFVLVFDHPSAVVDQFYSQDFIAYAEAFFLDWQFLTKVYLKDGTPKKVRVLQIHKKYLHF